MKDKKPIKTLKKENVTFRFDPKIKFLAEIAGRLERRSLTNYIEITLEQSFQSVIIDDKGTNLLEIANEIWSPVKTMQFVRMASSYPHLLDEEENEVLNRINNNFSNTFTYKNKNEIVFNQIRLDDYWELLIDSIYDNDAYIYLEGVEQYYRVKNTVTDEKEQKRLINVIINHTINTNSISKYEKNLINFINKNYTKEMIDAGMLYENWGMILADGYKSSKK